MSASVVSRGRPVGRKSPLRVVNEVAPFSFDDQPGPAAAGVRLEDQRPPELTAAQLRRLMISEFRTGCPRAPAGTGGRFSPTPSPPTPTRPSRWTPG
jgi:hypothetical protein